MLPFVLYSLNIEHLSNMKVMSIGSENDEAEPSLYYIINDHGSIITNSSIINGPFFDKHIALRATVGITCCLSMLGAVLIIASYFLVRDIQTKSRLILVQLSFADFGVACANFIGVTVYFDQYIRHCPNKSSHDDYSIGDTLFGNHSVLSCHTLRGLCKAQAFFAGFSTLASVLWTLCLAVYIYCLVVHSSKRVHYKVLYVAYVLCWGIPLFTSLWLISTDRLGYSPHGGSGWCTLKISNSAGKQDMFAVVFGNDLWIYLTFIMVTILYSTTHCYIKFQLKESNPYILQGDNLATVIKADTKFILIPFFFLLLRVWTMILVILLVYAHISPPQLLSSILLYAAGIGDSGQGFVNALLFCVFTPNVRKQFLDLLANSRCLKRLLPASLRQSHRAPDSQSSLSSTFPVMTSKNKKRISPCSSDRNASPQETQSQENQENEKNQVTEPIVTDCT